MNTKARNIITALLITAIFTSTPNSAFTSTIYHQITQVQPDSASQGQTVTITITLSTDSPPPPPPDIEPQNVNIDSIPAASAHQTQHTITAAFTIPSQHPTGNKDIEVIFNTPFDTLIYSLQNGFTVTHQPQTEKTSENYKIVDTAQTNCYGNFDQISPPNPGEDFYGQDAQFTKNQPDYTISTDTSTVYDNVTSLTWTRSADLNSDGTIDADDKLTSIQALQYPQTLNDANYGGYNDWRLPTIKELYSLMNFTGRDPSSETTLAAPFIDDQIFAFGYGDESAGERLIDAQWASSSIYTSTTMSGNPTMFGLNLADGRIKGYPTEKLFYAYFVRGNTEYGINNFIDNNDQTVSDAATGLMWSKNDSQTPLNWKQALKWVQTKNSENYLGYSDWRLPNAKELQSIVDYTRSPDATDSPAIDPIFNITQITNDSGQQDYPFFWSATTHQSAQTTNSATKAAYLSFGRAMGYSDNTWQDVHGAGAQRSDPKSGDPAEYPYGHGPQGDAIRIYNYVRLVRDIQCGQTGYTSQIPGDINNDCTVNFYDYAALVKNYNLDNLISKLLIIANNWLRTNSTD